MSNVESDFCVYALEVGENRLLYAPHSRVIALVTQAGEDIVAQMMARQRLDALSSRLFAERLRKFDFLAKPKFLVTDRTTKIRHFSLTRLMLLPTWRCNSSCVYCYSNAGDERLQNSMGEMPWVIAKAALKIIHTLTCFERIRYKHLPKIVVQFMGGGEPTLNLKLIKRSKRYLEQLCEPSNLTYKIHITTNGLFSKSVLVWAIQNRDKVSLSFSVDGPPEIQDTQRPLYAGGPSSRIVERNLKLALDYGLATDVHTVITELTEDRIPEIVAYFLSKFPAIRMLHLEPMKTSLRSERTSVFVPKPEAFVQGIARALNTVPEAARKLHSSPMTMVLRKIFCGALDRSNFIVTPKGLITLCTEVATRSDPRAPQHVVGYFDSSRGGFSFEQMADEYSRPTENSVPHWCATCLARWNCGGGCPIRFGYDPWSHDPPSITTRFHCSLHRHLTAVMLSYLLRTCPDLRGPHIRHPEDLLAQPRPWDECAMSPDDLPRRLRRKSISEDAKILKIVRIPEDAFVHP